MGLWLLPNFEGRILFWSNMCSLSRCTALCDRMDCSPPGFSVHGIFQARILEWVAISSWRGSSQPRDRTRVSCLTGSFFTCWAIRETPVIKYTCQLSCKRHVLYCFHNMKLHSDQRKPPLTRSIPQTASINWGETPKLRQSGKGGWTLRCTPSLHPKVWNPPNPSYPFWYQPHDFLVGTNPSCLSFCGWWKQGCLHPRAEPDQSGHLAPSTARMRAGTNAGIFGNSSRKGPLFWGSKLRGCKSEAACGGRGRLATSGKSPWE